MHIEDSIRDAVTKATWAWANPAVGDFEVTEDLADLVDRVCDAIAKSDMTHEVRNLRWKVKNLGKQTGKQGQRIYELRCQLAEVRSLVSIDASAHRSLRDQARAVLKRVNDQNAEIRELQLQLRDSNRAESSTNGHDQHHSLAMRGLA